MAPRETPSEGAAQVQVETESRPELRRKSRERRSEEVKRKYDFSVIRSLRQEKELTIEEFARVCGLSYAPISRIETNLIKPNLETLDKIAAGLGITTYNLVAMAERREAEVQKPRESRSGGFAVRSSHFDGLEVNLVEGRKGAVTTNPEFHTKDHVTISVRAGILELRLNDKTSRLGPGDAISYDCVHPHQYLAIEDTDFVVILHARR